MSIGPLEVRFDGTDADGVGPDQSLAGWLFAPTDRAPPEPPHPRKSHRT
jgi:hypothetical protein